MFDGLPAAESLPEFLDFTSTGNQALNGENEIVEKEIQSIENMLLSGNTPTQPEIKVDVIQVYQLEENNTYVVTICSAICVVLIAAAAYVWVKRKKNR